ncbi:MAG: DUF4271 domain-containing protein [Bacteroides sp.]
MSNEILGDTTNWVIDTLQVETPKDTLELYYAEQYTSGDSTHLVVEKGAPQVGFRGDPLAYRLRADDGVTAIVFLCFFFVAYVFTYGKRFLIQEVKDFYRTKERNSIFANSTAADFRYGLVLLTQTCILMGICCFDYFHTKLPQLFDVVHPNLVLGIYILYFALFYLLKWMVYHFLGWVFFDKSTTNMWLESYSTILRFFGISLFPIVLMMIYFDLSLNVLLLIALLLFLLTKLLMFYKYLKLFSSNLYGFLYLIVYFCALELMPCFILFQGIVQINNLLLIKY